MSHLAEDSSPWSMLPLGRGQGQEFSWPVTSEPLGLRLLRLGQKNQRSHKGRIAVGVGKYLGPHRRETKAIVTMGLLKSYFVFPTLKRSAKHTTERRLSQVAKAVSQRTPVHIYSRLPTK